MYQKKVRLYGQPNSAEAYAIRDFLNRSVVEFDWIELTCDQDCDRELGLPSLNDIRLPVVEFPDGTQTFAPTIREIAQRLGWVTQPRFQEYDLSIYGAGPAGLSAAVYAASEGLRTVLIERHAVGGQAGTSSLIENYMGFPEGISGAELAERARQQAVKFGVELLLIQEGIKAEFKNNRIYVDMADGSKMIARANICATGVEYRRLGLPNEDRYLNVGLFYGAGVSEAPMCQDEDVFVVGGGNSAGQAVMHFSRYAKKVTMLVRGDSLAATLSQYLIHRITNTSNIEVLYQTQVTGLDGDRTLRQIELTNCRDRSVQKIDTHRLFVCIGGMPNTEWAKDTSIIRDNAGYIVTGPDLLKQGRPPECWTLERDPFFLESSVPGSFAAGDVRHGSIKRVASAVGEGAMAVTFVHRYLAETA
ncbi:MAG: FAD-dependent oxidoreductase [Pelatocladus maniniholoensis HA4357-MV3]|jgi:thioredoxin reductase (NADPH)|uniref:FAD-dependent oxidoreductase n=1 Tax=Pelatocladus maniniholoensis HA4357-MV3 TaxID=1117104 RepID=A0A9E3H7B1_9NOST|nr:FAD-dependent oxidoreductase [Pelatocladus maniniholoensis HA4357-MV3]BAZ66544.1 response regulator receiver modulated FAD-dependent pyridine nucleotide-disulfide oxidoreductase [Fischerella sp. NIES-4106]